MEIFQTKTLFTAINSVDFPEQKNNEIAESSHFV